MTFRILSATLFFITLAYNTSFSGVIKGRILHSGTTEGLVGAAVWLKGTSTAVHTNVHGEFEISDLPEGSYIVNASYIGYNPSGDYPIEITSSEQVQELKISLVEAPHHSTQVVEVHGTLDQETDISARKQEKEADNVINLVSARAIELSPDITVANVAQRISGISLVRTAQGDSRYAIIRGMDPRYNNTLVNGVKIPSPDNESRFIPLDIIPADLLQKLEVHKTLTPDMEADATGGTINAVMKDAPDTTIFSVNGNIGYNQIMFDRPYSHFDAGAINRNNPSKGYDEEHQIKPTEFSRKNLTFQPIQADPNTICGITMGRRFFHKRVGVILSGANQINYSGTHSELKAWSYRGQEGYLRDFVNRSFSSRQNRTGVNFKIDYRFNEKHKIIFTNVFLRMVLQEGLHVTDTTQYFGGNGRTGPGTGYISYTDRSRMQIQQIESANLQGEHDLIKNLKFDWSAVYAIANSEQPDQASVNTHQLIEATRRNPPYFNSSNRSWQHNEDVDLVGKANLQYLLKWKELHSTFKIGGLYRNKKRSNYQDDYTLFPVKVNGSDPVYTNPDNINWYVYGGIGTPLYNTNNYTATEYITDVYVQNKLEFRKYSAVYGLRIEKTEQHWFVPFLVKYNDPSANAKRPLYTDFLPSINLKYLLTSKMNLKGAFYKSIVRPQFSEFIPVRSGLGGDNSITIGNENLKHAEVMNYEIRYEWFPNKKDVFAISGFHKSIKNAIEYRFDLAGAVTEKTAYNVTTPVENTGFEINTIKYFDKVRLIKNFGVNFNYTFTFSSVRSSKLGTYASGIPGNYDQRPTTELRPLQNQSRDLANFSLIYNSSKSGLNIQLSYLYQGKRLVNVVEFEGLDWYQKPYQNLSASVEKKFGKRFYLTIKVNNLLNTPYEVYVNTLNLPVQRDLFGQNYQIGLRYKL